MAQSSNLAIVFVVLLYCVLRLLPRLWHDPLAAAKKANWLVRYSGGWIWLQHWNDRSVEAVYQAHLRHGPVVRLGPSKLSVNAVEGGLDVIYSFREAMPKTNWYQVANSYGEEPMVAIRNEGPHWLRRKMLAQPYLKTSLRRNQRWVDAQQRLTKNLMSALDKLVTPSLDTDFHDLAFAWSVESITDCLFGLSGSLNLLADIPKARRTSEEYETQRAYQFLSLPSALLRRMGYQSEISWIRAMQQATQNASNTVYQHLSQGMRAAGNKDGPMDTLPSAKERAIIISEMQDHIIAGIDDSAVVLATCAWLLSLSPNQVWQRRLYEELHSSGIPTLVAI